MFSIIMTAFRESQTVGKAIAALLPQLPEDGELLVVCPDVETTAVIQNYARVDGRIKHLSDPQQGKPIALNIGLNAAQHDIVVLTDGDIVVDKQALKPLLAPFSDENVGAVTGQPISISPRHTMLGYWSHLLVHAAHQERQRRQSANQFLLCSGYLFAYRRSLVPQVPPDALAEDAVISHQIAQQGYAIRYVPDAIVRVKYPTTYADWLRQKVRSAGGYAQDIIRHSPFRMRSARLEMIHGSKLAFRFAQTWRERLWTLALFAARLHLWWLIFWRVRVWKRPLATLWQRVETTK